MRDSVLRIRHFIDTQRLPSAFGWQMRSWPGVGCLRGDDMAIYNVYWAFISWDEGTFQEGKLQSPFNHANISPIDKKKYLQERRIRDLPFPTSSDMNLYETKTTRQASIALSPEINHRGSSCSFCAGLARLTCDQMWGCNIW